MCSVAFSNHSLLKLVFTVHENDTMLRLILLLLHVPQIHFVLLISRQGKVRLTKWYSPYSQKERTKVNVNFSTLFSESCYIFCSWRCWYMPNLFLEKLHNLVSPSVHPKYNHF